MRLLLSIWAIVLVGTMLAGDTSLLLFLLTVGISLVSLFAALFIAMLMGKKSANSFTRDEILKIEMEIKKVLENENQTKSLLKRPAETPPASMHCEFDDGGKDGNSAAFEIRYIHRSERGLERPSLFSLFICGDHHPDLNEGYGRRLLFSLNSENITIYSIAAVGEPHSVVVEKDVPKSCQFTERGPCLNPTAFELIHIKREDWASKNSTAPAAFEALLVCKSHHPYLFGDSAGAQHLTKYLISKGRAIYAIKRIIYDRYPLKDVGIRGV